MTQSEDLLIDCMAVWSIRVIQNPTPEKVLEGVTLMHEAWMALKKAQDSHKRMGSEIAQVLENYGVILRYDHDTD